MNTNMKVKEHESKVICLTQFKHSLTVTRTQATCRSIFQSYLFLSVYTIEVEELLKSLYAVTVPYQITAPLVGI
jgi:hypothetical protein